MTTPQNATPFLIQNRRYIGNKHKLSDWIFENITAHCTGSVFFDAFAGTGVISAEALKHYNKVILNDFLRSNYVSYQAFFNSEDADESFLHSKLAEYAELVPEHLSENYFEEKFAGNFFTQNSAHIIGHIRDDIEKSAQKNSKEYFFLLASLIYSADKVANTVGHYEAFLRTGHTKQEFKFKPINPLNTKNNEVEIYRKDTNELAKSVVCDVAYIDPPYNSRQYSRFYHVLETLTKWDFPKLSGTALKPPPENMSEYSRSSATKTFENLIRNLNVKYIAVSYNNTYKSKSSSSKNKINLETIAEILSKRGETKTFSVPYKHFNAGNTHFDNHKEYLFITEVK
ncbi:MAG: DNA adenine methylase [Bifidobacteriaceae bacterium]|jgi:adenine-specific DNA-methyltransferase|nr:DNA adenine methylase [Bifidobacteriaceae bacterium]